MPPIAKLLCRRWLPLLGFLVLLRCTALASPSGEECIEPQAASFGILFGGVASPLTLRPLELARAEAPHALPLANPVLTPWLLKGVAAIADPVIVPHPEDPQRLTMFFAALPCASAKGALRRWGIAAAVSDSGGAAWRPQGWVLRDSERDLRVPMVFHHVDNWFMVPEAGGEEVRLYKAEEETFPAGWKFSRVLIEAPLRGVSIVRHSHRWWMIGSRPGAGLDGQQQVLSIHRAKSPLGPYEPHLNGSFAADAATTMGPVFLWKNNLHRLGRSCRAGTACGPVEVVQMFISDEAFEQDTLPLDLGRPLWRQRSRWNGAGWSQLSIARRIDGSYIAVMAASQLPPEPPALPARLERAVAAFKGLALLAIITLLAAGASRAAPGLRLTTPARCMGLLGRPLCLPSRKHEKVEDDWPADGFPDGATLSLKSPAAPHPLAIKLVVHAAAPDGDARSVSSSVSSGPCSAASSGSSSPSKLRSGAARPRSAGGYRKALMDGLRAGWAGSRPSSGGSSRSSSPPRRLTRARWPAALAAAALALALAGVWGARWAEHVAEPFLEQAKAVPVDGQYSRFTLMVMSYDKRLHELQWYVRHYSQCPSVGEILVVWNRGAPPNPRSDLQSAVPVRVRVEPINSMNNRFRPDPHLKFRSVLSLDDDILVPCATVEAAFAEWRRAPQRLLGFYPRLLRPAEPGGPPVYQFEEYVFQQRAYNAILAGAAFMDAATFFPLYFSAATTPARALVDEAFNCDDLLFNFVVANWTRGVRAAQDAAAAAGAGAAPPLPPPVQLARPRRRLDLSRLSAVGISHSPARFKAAADRCLAEFSALFGGGSPLLVEQRVPDGYGAAPTCAWPFDCMYLADPPDARTQP